MSDMPDPELDNLSSSEQEAKLIDEARELIVDGERDKALTKVQDALRLNKSNTDALWMFATLTTQSDKAIAALKRLLSLDSENDKARKLLTKFESENDELLSGHEHEEGSQSEIMRQMLKQQQALLEQQNRQPVINITNMASNVANQTVGAVGGARRNETAFIVGLLAAIFLGIFGLAHLLNGKVGTGILYWIIGWVIWLPLALLISSTGIGACLMLPLHIWVSYSQAKNGATLSV
ncbi:MAG: TM2 domain-containing protein [Anaerolineaceae bacterium]|nr:TM2 domain-containing protein [Anaerolineaceae bacterium]